MGHDGRGRESRGRQALFPLRGLAFFVSSDLDGIRGPIYARRPLEVLAPAISHAAVLVPGLVAPS
jgi:hypothetical protein